MDIIEMINKIDSDASGNKKSEISISVVSNFCQEPFFSKCLCLDFIEANTKVKIHYYNDMDFVYEEKKKELLGSDLIILFINYELKYDRGKNSLNQSYEDILNDSIALISFFEKNAHSHLFVIGYEDFYNLSHKVSGYQIQNCGIDYVNQQIKQRISKDTVMVDLKSLITVNGLKSSYDYKSFCRWGNPYSKILYQTLSKEIVQHYGRFMSKKIKCLVLDCDNVLWGGNVSDSGADGVELGETYRGYVYQKFQKYVFELFKRGMILTLCSKNDVQDVWSVFDNNSNMILKSEFISTYRINWMNKAENILSMSKEIGIDPGNMLFIDDSHNEIECVKQSIPGINVLLFQPDSFYEDISISYLDGEEALAESMLRTKTYKSNKMRTDLLESSATVDDYLININNEIEIKMAEEKELKRISELSLRTNRMSSQKRYDVTALRERYNRKDYQLFSVYVSDKFGDLGLVGCMGIDVSLQNLDLFCLSCRALGRHVENKMIEFIKINYPIEHVFFNRDSKNEGLYDLFVKNF